MLTEKEKKTLARYEQQLLGPKWKFVLAYGIAFTLGLLLVLTPIEMLLQKTTLKEILSKAIWIRIIFSILLGFLFGLWFWNFLSLKCRKLKMKDSTSQ